MDREYLEDYEEKEKAEYERLVLKRIREGGFDSEKDRYPPDERFVKLQRPVALASSGMGRVSDNFWAEIPFCGSLILLLPSYPKHVFEQKICEVSEIPELLTFIKQTGRLQIAFNGLLQMYEGLDYLNPFFEELRPPVYPGFPFTFLGNKKEVQETIDTFYTLGKVKYFEFLKEKIRSADPRDSSNLFALISRVELEIYSVLRLCRYSIAEDIENLMVDDPSTTFSLFGICQQFITNPILDTRSDIRNWTLETVKSSQVLPLVYQPEQIRFPCEIGKFLLKKLTYAAQDIRACYDLIDHYDSYDLQKVQESLNEAILTNHPDIVQKSSDELSEVLDNVWNDQTIPRQIKNLKRGIPISIAAIGSAVSAFTSSLEGFLAGLGFSVGAKFLDLDIEGLSERLVKFFSLSYQANVYDFKKKYKGKIARP